MFLHTNERKVRTFLLTALLAGTLGISACSDQESSSSEYGDEPAQSVKNEPIGKVIARLGDITVTEPELAMAREELRGQFNNAPADQADALILNALIDIKLLAEQAREAGLDKEGSVRTRLEFFETRTLHNEWFQREALSKIADEDIKARYDAEIANLPKETEISARHILVKSEEEAKALIAELEGGANFEELAKAKSTGPSGPNGGQLGYFGKGQMVPPFEEAVFALEKGAFTKTPVQTQFGWHVILKEDERDRQPPEFEAVKDNIRQAVARERYVNLVNAAREKYKIEILDEELKSKVEALN